MFAVRLIGVLALVALNGFFAAAEFSLVAVRLSRVRQLVKKGDVRAKVVESLLSDLHRVVSGVQLGITLTSLALGALGESTLALLIQSIWPRLARTETGFVVHAFALALAFALLSALHVVLGELVPKSLSLARAERVALLIARPFQWFLKTFRWAITFLDVVSSAIVRSLGVSSSHAPGSAHSTEELQIQIQQARERGLLAPGEEKFIVSAIELGQVQVREIMVPRPDMHVLPAEASLDEVMRAFATTQRSRIPVYRGTEDQILGFVHIKDMLWVLLDRERRLEENLTPNPFDLRHVLREVLIVPETKPASELLFELRSRRAGLALVVDEFGSILGLVTLEDILEQVVGEIHDEFDVVERPLTLADGAVIFDAALNVRDLDAQYNITLPEDPAYATVGGFVLDQLGFIPRGGESFEFGSFRFTVVEMDGRRVARVKIQRMRQAIDEHAAEHAATADTSGEARAKIRGSFGYEILGGNSLMAKHLLHRFLLTLPALWLVLTLVFLMIHIVPGDPVEQMLGEGAAPGELVQLRHALNLDQPLLVQYGHYFKRLAHGDLGQSFKFQAPVRRIIFERYPATLQLAFLALLVCAAIAIPAGILAAHRRGQTADRVVGLFTLFGLAFPNFALGPVLILLFSIELRLLPVSGRGGLANYILPAATLGAALAAILTRMVRSSMLEELSSDYVRTARAKGLSTKAVLLRHAFRNALIPIITILGLQFGTLLAGTIVTETIFSWPGIGRLTVQAISSRDYPLLQGCILVIAVSYVFVNLLTDVLYAMIDPRVRFS